LSSELSALRGQLAKLEQGSGVVEAATPLQQQAVKAYRDVKVQEAMLEVLIKQYELARVDEAKEGPLLQQLDVATAPERKAKPKRAIIVLVAALAGLSLGLLLAFVRRTMRKVAESEQGSSQMALLQKAWRFKR
jgi:uncharacterized protein involved in exopolysaccharide biosynthesis